MTRLAAALIVTIATLLMAIASGQAQEPDADIAAIVGQVEQPRLLEHLEQISEPRSALPSEIAQLEATADYVQSQLAGFGYNVMLQDVELEEDEIGSIVLPNIIGVKEGSECPDRIFVVGAHYDSVPETPGADDDASGVAGMLEIARVLSDVDVPATVYFTGFTLEEAGLVGSRVMAADFAEANAEVVGMYSLEMIGYTDPATSAEFILVLGSEFSAGLIDATDRAKAYVPELPIVTLATEGNGETSPDTRRSDHAPFWDAGYQALFVTDTANFRNPNYHQPSDTVDTLNLPFATNVTKAMLATTLLHLTRDDDANGAADVCTAPLLATATPPPADTPIPAATAAPSTTTPSGVTPPSTGTGSQRDSDGSALAIAVAAALLGVALGCSVMARRRITKG